MSTPSASTVSHRKLRTSNSKAGTETQNSATSNRGSSSKLQLSVKCDYAQPIENEDRKHADHATKEVFDPRDEVEKEQEDEQNEEDADGPHLKDDEDDEDDDYPSVGAVETQYIPTESFLPPPVFNPLFAIINDTQISESQHPSVYYVFADDVDNEREGHDVVTVASLTALKNNNDEEESREPSEQDGQVIEERLVLVDMERSGDDDENALRVRKISSLSPAWAVTSATLRPAPTLDDESSQGETLMLKVEGIEIKAPPKRHAKEIKPTTAYQEDAERRAADLLEVARKHGSGSIVDGMSEIYRQLNQGLVILDQISGEAELNPPEE